MPDLTFEQKFRKLPPYVQEWMAREESTKINAEIAKKYGLSLKDTAKMVWLISRTIIGDIKPEEFLNKLKEKLPHLGEDILRQMALDIAVKRFFPIRDFLEGTEALIRNLGGEVPQNEQLFSEKYQQILAARQKTPDNQTGKAGVRQSAGINSNIVYVNIGEISEKYPSIQNQFITSQPIKLQSKERPVNATLANWLKDYQTKKGAPPHSSMDRTDYLFNSENTSKLDNSERTILGNVLKAYDEGGELPLDKNSGKLVLSELFHQATPMPYGTKTEPTQRKQPGNVVDLRQP